MADNGNLKKGNPETQFRSGREAVENGRKGGRKSGAVRRQKFASRKFLKEVLALEAPITPELKRACKQYGIEIPEGVSLTNEDLGVLALIKKYRSGDLRAYDMVHEYLAEDPHTIMEEKRLKAQQELTKAIVNKDGFMEAIGASAGEVFEDGGDTPDDLEDEG